MLVAIGDNTGINSGDLTLAAVGSAPSANGASLSAQVLTLQPADGTHPGLLTSGTQTIGGNKTFSGTISASGLSGSNTGDITLVAVGSSPSANGASLSGQSLTLQPADGTHPGLLTSGTQTIGGTKTFSAGQIIGNITYNNGQLLGASGIQLFPATGQQLQLYGNQNPGAGASNPSVLISTAQTATGTDRIVNFANNGTVAVAVDLNGKHIYADYSDQSGSPGNCTANAVTGRAAIASTASTCVVSNTRVAANSIILLQMESDGTAVANVVLDSKSAGTSFTVKAVNGTGVVSVTTGTTVFSWLIIN